MNFIVTRYHFASRWIIATMVDSQHFCLRWNNYQSSITSAFENLRDDEDFVDVTLACDGKSLKAHRVVLSACSPYFRELLKVCSWHSFVVGFSWKFYKNCLRSKLWKPNCYVIYRFFRFVTNSLKVKSN